MNIGKRCFSRPASAAVLMVPLLCGFACFAQSKPLSGSFGFLLNAAIAPTSTDTGSAILGVINFDGAGNGSGSYNFQLGASDTDAGQSMTGSFSGTYSGKPDGTGSLTLNLDLGFSMTFATVITDGGKGLQMVATGCTDFCDIRGGVSSGIARAVSAGSPLKGNYGYQFNNSPIPAQSLGVLGFDGAGNVSVSLLLVGAGDDAGDPHQAPTFSATAAGTYTLNPDGSGTILLPAAFGGGDQTYAFVVVDGGSTILAEQMNRSNKGVSSGTARLQ